MTYFEPRKTKSVDIGLTPLLDVIFILLIFAILAANFQRIRGIPLELPKVSRESSQTLPPLSRAVISIDKKGAIYYKNKVISYKELELFFRKNKKKFSSIVIRGDSGAPLGVALRVLDLAKRYRYSEVVILSRELSPSDNSGSLE